MKNPLRILVLLCVWSAVVYAQAPAVAAGGVLNTASYTFDGLPGAGVAQGSMIVIYGERMGPAAPTWGAFPLLPVLAGTNVKITSGTTTVDALMVYTEAGLIKAIVPSNTPVGEGFLTVTYNGVASQPVPVKVVRSGFGIFTLNQAGSGPAVLTDPAYTVNTLASAMPAGSTVTIWGTGLGPAVGDESKGPVALDPAIAGQVEVWVGGQRATVTYAGRGGGFAGLDQINFVVPPGVEGCYVPIYVKIGQSVSNHGSMSISASGKTVCTDSFSYSEADLQKAQASGLKTGNIVLSRTLFKMSIAGQSLEVKADIASGDFGAWSFTSLISSQGIGGISTLGSCVVHNFRGSDATSSDPVRAEPLDAGPSLQLNGPKGAKTIDLKQKGVYASVYSAAGVLLPGVPAQDYLEPGTYTVTGTGGTDIGPFTATLTMPARLVWTNQDAISEIPRNQDLKIDWSGGASTDAVVMLGTSVTDKPEVGAAFICTERPDRGTFTIPAAILGSLPVSSVDSDGISTAVLSVGNMPSLSQARFTASGLDAGYFYYSTMNAKSVKFK